MLDIKRLPLLPSLGEIRSAFDALHTERPDPAEILEAINQLQADLDCALNVFSNRDKKDGQIVSLWGALRFLAALRIDTRLRQPLRSIVADLTDTDRKPAQKALFEYVQEVEVAAALDTLIEDGIGAQLAAERLAEIVACSMSAGHLITFRENLRRRGRARPEAVRLYEDLRKSIKMQLGHLSAEERIKEVLLSVYGNVISSKKP